MKKLNYPLLISILLIPQYGWADQEIEIEFRYQPDRSGKETRNQGIKLEDDEIEVYLDGKEWKSDAATEDFDRLFKLVAQELKAFELIEGKEIKPPYTEVKMEFSGEDREIEISRSYPAGKMPKGLISLQQQYLKEVWK